MLKKIVTLFSCLITVAIISAVHVSAASVAFSGRLDGHTGESPWQQGEWVDSAGTHHYICAGDWLSISGNYVTYPITVPTNTSTTYGPTLQEYLPGAACYRTPPSIGISWNEGQWYNYDATEDVWAGNDAGSLTANHPSWNNTIGAPMAIYIDRNKSFSTQYASSTAWPVLYLSGVNLVNGNLASWAGTTNYGKFYAQGYPYLADLSWGSNTNIGYNGLQQGGNTINVLASDAWGNMTAENFSFYYDTVAPYASSVSIQNVTSSGYDVYIYGVGDATSGVQQVRCPTWSNNNQSDIIWEWATNLGGGTWYYHVDKSSFGNSTQGYCTNVYIYDNAGNQSGYAGCSNINLVTAPTGNLSGTLIVSSHYYENTYVTGAVDISYTNSAPSSDLIPSSGVTVQITEGINVITKTILCPANNTSWIPFEFLTPSCPGDSSIPLTISAVINPTNAISETNYADNDLSQQIWIDSAKYTEPPATFYQPSAPNTWKGVTAGSYPSTNSLTWSEWRYVNNALVLKSFYVDATASMQMTPDTRIASSTLNNGIWTMRSGYGFSNSTVLNITTNYDQPSLITTPQRIRVYFPEFDYNMQNNFTQLDTLSQTGTSNNYTFNYAFKQNPQSDILARLHFTPLWFPDGPYIVLENARDLWTPAGQLNLWGSYELNISGSVFDDWNASVVPNRD